MNDDDLLNKPLDVDAIAARHPRINAAKFKEWQRKMARLKRFGFLEPDPPRPRPPRTKMPEPYIVGTRRRCYGNLPGAGKPPV